MDQTYVCPIGESVGVAPKPLLQQKLHFVAILYSELQEHDDVDRKSRLIEEEFSLSLLDQFARSVQIMKCELVEKGAG